MSKVCPGIIFCVLQKIPEPEASGNRLCGRDTQAGLVPGKELSSPVLPETENRLGLAPRPAKMDGHPQKLLKDE